MALDSPVFLHTLTVMGIIPTLDVLSIMDPSIALGLYHWFLLAQPELFPERLLGSDPDYFIAHTLDSWCSRPGAIGEAARSEYMERFRDPGVVHAACQDYRAALTIDAEADAADVEAGRKIVCPTLVAWGDKSLRYVKDIPGVWKRWALNLEFVSLDCGHFVMEERPRETAKLISRHALGGLLGNLTT